MATKKPGLSAVDLFLISGIVFFTVAGIIYAGLSGVVSIPGIKPILARTPTAVPTVEAPTLAPVIPSASPTLAAQPTPSPSPTATTAAASPSPATAPSPSPSPTAVPSPTAEQLDAASKQALADIQVPLEQYKTKNKSYPKSANYSDGRTDKTTTALRVLVDQGLIKSLPTPPDVPTYWYGYRSNGSTYELTARLRNTSDPSGKYDEAGNYLYTVTNVK